MTDLVSLSDINSLSRKPGLYIHIPFCRTRCNYCDFATSENHDNQCINEYLDCIAREAGIYSGVWSNFDSLYIGGGTPSLMSARQLHGLFAALYDQYQLENVIEITMEANPGDVTVQLVREWKKAGINRVSLGVQAMDDHSLSLLGRRHDVAQACSAMNVIRNAGISLGTDLIFGFPGQTQAQWTKSLISILQYCPDHLSCYQLSIEPGTVMDKMIKSGRLIAAHRDHEADLFHLTQQILTDNGFDHYEVSNYARSSSNYAVHNSKYWIHAPYLGLGAAAHSFNGSVRWANHRTDADYRHAISSGSNPVEFTENIDAATARTESIFMGLRTKWGVACETLAPEITESSSVLNRFIQAGWLKETPERWIPTPAGLAVADYMAVEFISELTQ